MTRAKNQVLRYSLVIASLIGGFFRAETVAGAKGGSDERPSAIDEATRTVVYLEFEQIASEKTAFRGAPIEADVYYRLPEQGISWPKRARVQGTGFLVGSDGVFYVVTAKHVVKNARSTGKYWISPIEGEIISGTFEELRGSLKGAKWFFHESADLAIHPIILRGKRTVKIVPKESLPREAVELLTQVCVPGFPHSLGRDSIRLGPLVASTAIMSWPALLPGSASETRVIFLRDRLAKGYSGSPVYSVRPPPSRGVLSRHTMRLVGVVSQAIAIPAGIGSGAAMDEFSCIVPASSLRELLDSDQVREFEEVLMRQGKARAQTGGEAAILKAGRSCVLVLFCTLPPIALAGPLGPIALVPMTIAVNRSED